MTGGSRGLGKDICEMLLKSEASVITTARNASPEIKELIQRFGKRFKFIPCDLSDKKQLENFLNNESFDKAEGFVPLDK